MANDSTTIRVSTRTRDRLRDLAARRGEPAGDVIAELVDAADEDTMLAEAEASFDRIAGDPGMSALYRAETEGLEGAFDAAAPAW